MEDSVDQKKRIVIVGGAGHVASCRRRQEKNTAGRYPVFGRQ
jgi:hypothetical protein